MGRSQRTSRAVCHTQSVRTASTQIQWGDVATWVGGAATAIALFLTYRLLRITRREQRTLQAEKRQAQARLISAWTGQLQQVPGDPTYSIVVTLQNSSDEPVYGLRAAVGFTWSGQGAKFAEAKIVYLMPPKSSQQEKVYLESTHRGTGATEPPLPVELIFSDAVGKHWHRNRYGRLTEIADDLPLSGDMHFFRPTAGSE